MPKFPSDDELDFFSLLPGGQDEGYYDPEALLEQIGVLPQHPEVSWLVVPLPLPAELVPPEAGGDAPLMLLILTPEGSEPALFELAEDPEEAELMVLQVLSEGPHDVPAYRPAALRVPDMQWAFSLGNVLRDSGVQVVHETAPEVLEMVAHSRAQMDAQAASQREQFTAKPFLVGLEPDVVREYVRAFTRFMEAGAWEVLPPDKPLFAAWTDEGGERQSLYATVMGDMGESFGVAFFPDWLTYAEQIENSFDQELVVAATGGMEAVIAGGEDSFAPQDWAYLKELKLVKGRHPQLPSLLRMSLEGTLPPRTPVHVVTGILNVLADRAEKKGTRATSMKGNSGGVQVTYPGKPRDELRPEELTGTVTLTMRGGSHLAPGLTFTVTAPSGELVSKMYAQISRQIENNRQHQQLWAVLPMQIMRPDPRGEDDRPMLSPLDLLRPQGIRVWSRGQGGTPVVLAQLTRRAGLSDGHGLSIDVQFSPEPTTEFQFAVTGKATGKPDNSRRVQALDEAVNFLKTPFSVQPPDRKK